MLKPVIDSSDNCGQPNPLVTLSKNFGQTNSLFASGVEQTIQRAIPNGAGTLLAQEYLDKIAEQTPAPNTFDMRKLMAKLPTAKTDNIRRGMEQSWEESRQLGLANWSAEFEQNRAKDQQKIDQNWAKEFAKERKQMAEGPMEREWQIAHSSSTWAKDFLDRYDSSAFIPTSLPPQHQPFLATENLMAREWEQEFLKYMSEWNAMNSQQKGEGMDFFDYETAWEEMHLKKTQERYGFSQENPFVGEENAAEKARETFAEGRVADSILHYEAALQKDPQNVQIWYSLGVALAENEDDPRAISALRNALKLNPRHKDALLALSVSLANESFDHLALHELHKWICVHEGRENMPEDTIENTATLYRQYTQLDRTEFIKVEQQFLTLARQSGTLQVDPELQNALGVLYNLGRDYDRAVDCIQAALASRPEDPVLWNRLGATLANADRSAESINAYKRALHLFPAYVRARYNLGIACMNLNSFRDAAGHFVGALQIQNSPDQSQIWSKLRSALIRLDGPVGLTAECYEALEKRQLATVAEFLRATQ